MSGAELQNQLDEARGTIEVLQEELGRTNSELLQLTIELEDRVAARTAELADSEQRYRTLVEGAGQPIYAVDGDGVFLFMNGLAAKELGGDAEDFVGRPMGDLFPEEVAERQMNRIREVIQSGAARRHENESIIRGEKRYYDTGLYPLKNLAGETVSVLGISQDITDRRRAEAALAQRAEELGRSNAELQQFAYVVSHDLQEPLRSVISYLQLLVRRCQNQLDADAERFVSRTVAAAERMKTLINDLLKYSRVGTQGQPFAPTDCSELLGQVLDNLKVAVEESQAVVTHDELPTVMADAMQLSQLLQNLIGNALKFRGDRAPATHVGADRQEGAWLFSVRDNGIGIEPQYVGRIFQVFQRLHTRREYPGTGIGLSICKRIVERHGGRIWVESEGGNGSTFYFTIPDRQAAATGGAGTAAPVAPREPGRIGVCPHGDLPSRRD